MSAPEALDAARGGPSDVPVVATSVNPFGDIAHQRRCFLAWRALGFSPHTFNSAEEASSLVATGFEEADILLVAEADTGLALFGKTVPRVLPTLGRLAALYGDRPVILVNADIYPAARHGDVMRFWLAEAPAVGLTREDCTLLEAHTLLDSRPYRNGLDAFVFRPGTLAAVIAALKAHPVSQRMCFGVPGWDFLLGAVVRAPAIGGRLMDSAVLLHEEHRQTYANVDEFAHYIPAMAALGETDADNAADAAYAFHRTIVADCAAAAGRAAFVRAISYAPPPARADDAARRTAHAFAALAPFVRWNYDFQAMAALAARQARPGASLERTRAFFKTAAGPEHGFTEELGATLFHLMCAREPRPVHVLGADERPAPLGALGPLLKETATHPPLRRERLAAFFGGLLVEHGLFSPALFDTLALSCGADDARTFLSEIHALVRRVSDAH